MDENILKTIEEAKKEIQAVCEKYRVTLVPVTIHRGDQTLSSIDIYPVSSLEKTEK